LSHYWRVVEIIEEYAAELVEAIIRADEITSVGEYTKQELIWVRDRLLPALRQTNQELINLLRGLNGHYIASGASGAPRGRPEVLPTGRNFYSVDIRAIPPKPPGTLDAKQQKP
jgi:cobaltochelatase CobN